MKNCKDCNDLKSGIVNSISGVLLMTLGILSLAKTLDWNVEFAFNGFITSALFLAGFVGFIWGLLEFMRGWREQNKKELRKKVRKK